MAKKKKPAKKPPVKRSAKKSPKKSVNKSIKKAARKASAKKKRAQKKPAQKQAVQRAPLPRMLEPGFLSVQVAPALEDRLIDLAMRMAKPLDQVLAQALSEFADTWEDHMRTVNALNQSDDRVQLVVPSEAVKE